MEKRGGFFRLGMIHKLVLANVMVFLLFGVVVVACLLVFRNMESLFKGLIDNNINRVIANAQISRDLHRIIADTDLLVATFLHGDRDVVRDGIRIADRAAAVARKCDDRHLINCLDDLAGRLRSLFKECAEVRRSSEKLGADEDRLNRGLTSLEETLSQKLVSLAMEGKDVSILEQLSILMPDYRETLLQISLGSTKLGLQGGARQRGCEGRQLLALLDDLQLRLRPVAASEPDVTRYGLSLMSGTRTYKREMLLFLQAVDGLDRRLEEVAAAKKHLQDDIMAIDSRISHASGDVLRRVTAAMETSRAFIIILAAVIFSLLGAFTVYFIYSNIRRPMKIIHQGIDSIRRGDLDTRIQLKRHDEWSMIEDALNDMVTDLQSSYGELKTSEAKWHSLYDNLPGGSFTVNRDYVIEDVNDLLCSVTGYSRKELVGQRCDIICPKGPHKCPVFDLGKERIENDETSVRAKDGRLVPIIKSARRIPMAEKDVIVENFQDITDRKQLEEQLLHAQKMEAVGQLAGGIAHDFNNILTAIIGYGTLLQMKIGDGDPCRANVEQILGAAERAADVTRGLLSLSRKRVFELCPVLLNECLVGMEGLLSRLIREDIEFRTEVTSEALAVMGDRSQLEQVLINLVTNARDSMPEGGMLTLRLERKENDGAFMENNGFEQADSYAVITVTDTGTGMDEETRERIFEPFYTTKIVGKGTGLGLAIVYGIVKQHNGSIRVASELGKGAEFRVCLPLVEAHPVAQPPQQTGESLEGSGTVLLAEDEQAVRDLMRSVLEEHGYTVLVAVNGMEAVEQYSEHRDLIDLLIMDVIMPKMNGKDALDAIRRVSPHVKVLFTSGYTGDVLNNKGIEGEGLHFVAKPVVPRELLRKVRHILDS